MRLTTLKTVHSLPSSVGSTETTGTTRFLYKHGQGIHFLCQAFGPTLGSTQAFVQWLQN
jgi:hypothetical protein